MPAIDQAPRKKSVRKPLPEHLARDEQVYAPPADVCPACGGGLSSLGKDVAEQLEYVPARCHIVHDDRSACKAVDPDQ